MPGIMRFRFGSESIQACYGMFTEIINWIENLTNLYIFNLQHIQVVKYLNGCAIIFEMCIYVPRVAI